MHLRPPLAFTLLLVRPFWHCSLVLAPVSYRPSREGYNSCLCLGWENTALAELRATKVSIASDKGLDVDAVWEADSVFVLAKNFEVGSIEKGSFNVKSSIFWMFFFWLYWVTMLYYYASAKGTLQENKCCHNWTTSHFGTVGLWLRKPNITLKWRLHCNWIKTAFVQVSQNCDNVLYFCWNSIF